MVFLNVIFLSRQTRSEEKMSVALAILKIGKGGVQEERS